MAHKDSAETRRTVRDSLERILSESLPDLSADDIRATFGMLVPPDRVDRMTYQELMLRQLVLKACAGNDKSIGEVLDRLIGKPTQTTEIKATQNTYHTFLLECLEADQREKVGLPREPEPTVIDVPTEQPETDILADLL